MHAYDSCIFYARRTIAVDSTFAQAYFWLSKSFVLTGNIDSANKYKDIYSGFVENDTTLRPNLEFLESLIKDN